VGDNTDVTEKVSNSMLLSLVNIARCILEIYALNKTTRKSHLCRNYDFAVKNGTNLAK